MLDALLLKEAFYLRVLELCPVVASNLFLSLSRTHFELISRIPLMSLGFVIYPTKRTPKWSRKNHQQLQDHTYFPRCWGRQRVQRDPYEEVPVVLTLSSHFCYDECFPPVSLPDMLHKVCLSRSRHQLVLTHDLPLEVYECSSQHVLDGDAKASTY